MAVFSQMAAHAKEKLHCAEQEKKGLETRCGAAPAANQSRSLVSVMGRWAILACGIIINESSVAFSVIYKFPLNGCTARSKDAKQCELGLTACCWLA